METRRTLNEKLRKRKLKKQERGSWLEERLRDKKRLLLLPVEREL